MNDAEELKKLQKKLQMWDYVKIWLMQQKLKYPHLSKIIPLPYNQFKVGMNEEGKILVEKRW